MVRFINFISQVFQEMSAAVLQRHGNASHTEVPGLIRGKIGNFKYFPETGITRVVGQNLNHFFLLKNIPWLNPKPSYSVLLPRHLYCWGRFVHWLGILNLAAPLVLFNESISAKGKPGKVK